MSLACTARRGDPELEVMAMQRLAADDAVMLWPDPRWPQETGALAILDGTNPIDDVAGQMGGGSVA